MAIDKMIFKIRSDAKLSQEEFGNLFGVSRQSVQKWESGLSAPELDNIIKIAKHFGITIDCLVLESDNRITEELKYNKEFKPKYANIHDWEFYSSNSLIEYQQSIEEGLDVSEYKELFDFVAKLPKNEIKESIGDVLFKIVGNAPMVEDYPYLEPSELDSIKNLRKQYILPQKELNKNVLEDKIYGAWLGRVCGCMLGKTVEGIRSNEFIPFLKESDNFPMYRYIQSTDVKPEMDAKYNFRFANRDFIDKIDGMPVDDDTNYVVLAQVILDKYGRDFTPYNVSRVWLDYQPKGAYCTAERVAFCNFVNGYEPPESAMYKNPFREWIGAQIRGDYFGYINPGDPETAADMAFRDASVSHVKNGIYGEMFIAAMISAAAVTNSIEEIINAGLGEIPATSRLYKDITDVIESYKNGKSYKDTLGIVQKRYDEYTGHGWCHTNSNAMIVVISLLYGEGDFGKSICTAVQSCYDTDCNGATVGSIIGMIKGAKGIDKIWTDPFGDKLKTSIFGVGTVNISDMAKKTMNHLKKI